MSAVRRDGGPAFASSIPRTITSRSAGGWDVNCERADGMSLRDYFAAAIVPSLIQLSITSALAGDQDWKPWTKDEIASKAYAIADAMLAERAR